ncbi:MAG: aminomethyl-transferring glycine dehydrogenase subunit GcvPB, partial [Candidatus Dormibacteria bacterium]
MTVTSPSWTEEEPLIFELAEEMGEGPRLPAPGVMASGLAEGLPSGLGRTVTARIPAVSEPELARHFGRLARRNHNLQQGAYPLGSCTMKYNPAVNEQVAALDGL